MLLVVGLIRSGLGRNQLKEVSKLIKEAKEKPPATMVAETRTNVYGAYGKDFDRRKHGQISVPLLTGVCESVELRSRGWQVRDCPISDDRHEIG
jgi:hypothetical protein